MNKDRLNRILEEHKLWLNGEGGAKANLRYTNLSGADLCDTDLRYVDLSYTNLRGADLRGADLRGVDLNYADLRGADLRGADLRYVDLSYTNLRGADLRGVDLRGVDLRGADLDFSVFPLWCGSFDIKVDERLPIQLLYHIAKMNIKTDDADLKRLLKLKTFIKVCNKFHRANECGKVGDE